MNRVRWGAIIAAVPLFAVAATMLCGSVVLLYGLVAESPMRNGAIVFFGSWLVYGMCYLAVSGDPY